MKKRFGTLVALLLCLTMSCSLALGGCNKNPDSGSTDGPGITDPSGNNNENNNNNNNEENNNNQEVIPPIEEEDEEFAVSYRTDYAPEYFEDVTYEVTELAEGVNLVKHTMTLTKGSMEGKTCVVHTVEVNLKKANVVAGTKNNESFGYNWEKTTPYQTALAWEADNEGEQVYASINADFFGSYSVNAFVKDGVIIKDSHNETGVSGDYNYTNVTVDVPASAPMLFGVKGTTAQIAPIKTVEGDPTDPDVKKQWVQAKLSYSLKLGNTVYAPEINKAPVEDNVTFYSSPNVISLKGATAVKVDTSKGATAMKVLEIKDITVSNRTDISGGDGYGWLLVASRYNAIAEALKALNVGDTISLSVKSPDGAWDGYETILGCRQALVINNEIPETLKLENTNGAQTQDIPRTAVGVRNGKVVLFAVESLYYYAERYNYTADPETDFHGMNLPELAEFAYYYGCSDAANFDGGGSTHLVVRGEGETEARTVVRAAEYFTRGLNDTRVVMNAFLITSRRGN